MRILAVSMVVEARDVFQIISNLFAKLRQFVYVCVKPSSFSNLLLFIGLSVF